jgi:putative FmdB family regulatory protein
MPHYNYHCSNCNHQTETFQKISDEPLKVCPQCQKTTLRRGPGGGIGIQFQGAGFYSTDYDSARKAEDHSKQDNPSEKTRSTSCCPCSKSNCSS